MLVQFLYRIALIIWVESWDIKLMILWTEKAEQFLKKINSVYCSNPQHLRTPIVEYVEFDSSTTEGLNEMIDAAARAHVALETSPARRRWTISWFNGKMLFILSTSIIVMQKYFSYAIQSCWPENWCLTKFVFCDVGTVGSPLFKSHIRNNFCMSNFGLTIS